MRQQALEAHWRPGLGEVCGRLFEDDERLLLLNTRSVVLEQVEVRVDAARVVRLVAEELRLFGVCGQAATRAELRPMLAQVGVQSRTTFFGHIK